MDYFNYSGGVLHAEQVNLEDIAKQHGTPAYVYSRATLERHWKAFDQALAARPHLICYAVKANSNLAVLNVLARLGSGFDIVSVGELERVLLAGGQADKVVFSGVGKQPQEIRRALEVGIRCFNVESEPELRRINQIAGELGVLAPISLRVNPDVDAKTHPYISTGLKENKFGLDVETALTVYRQAADLPHVQVVGIDCHIGSQLTRTEPFVDALRRMLDLVGSLNAEGIHLQHLDLGGGLGIRYRDENPPLPEDYAREMLAELQDLDYEILLEPGRAIAGNAGVLLTRVEYLKPTADKYFAVVDTAMNDLIRPALYDAWMDIVPVRPRDVAPATWDIVGPVCETGDFLGKSRALALETGDLLAIRSAGAYGYVMSSNYNTRPRPPEIMVDGDRAYLVNPRESLDALLARETLLPD
ncbi:diaminopimelate decarboxylase [Ectothiorhodosinus mongolicus]|uniref:Diaminopimelate decarboxylase n=1 Tax=Ectothiorhodosinus mongolicus TaxID=233100 RepID=A0A1R3W0P0_9GAMM|nr:diaminopimelate decarboxylase [Ectothiorhodosinus mongolicus]ULX56998.1 diaminopimelate decarboxylase [Ectothiorhodosinus mongolicus]SIT69387.1 diaminopimelate decarboxylase [Ectothiorhodosinus mongolicus]